MRKLPITGHTQVTTVDTSSFRATHNQSPERVPTCGACAMRPRVARGARGVWARGAMRALRAARGSWRMARGSSGVPWRGVARRGAARRCRRCAAWRGVARCGAVWRCVVC
eukprot:4009702-Prymnesium_polylepis.1